MKFSIRIDDIHIAHTYSVGFAQEIIRFLSKNYENVTFDRAEEPIRAGTIRIKRVFVSNEEGDVDEEIYVYTDTEEHAEMILESFNTNNKYYQLRIK